MTEEKKSDSPTFDLTSLETSLVDGFGLTSLDTFDSFGSAFHLIGKAEWSMETLLKKQKCFGDCEKYHRKEFNTLMSWLERHSQEHKDAKIVFQSFSDWENIGIIKCSESRGKLFKQLFKKILANGDASIYSATFTFIFLHLYKWSFYCELIQVLEVLEDIISDTGNSDNSGNNDDKVSTELFGTIYYVVGCLFVTTNKICKNCNANGDKEYSHLFDPIRAGNYLLKAAERNVIDAQFHYADFKDISTTCHCSHVSFQTCSLPNLCNPKDVAKWKNNEEAIKWYTIAAKNGEEYSINNLAIAYRCGDIVKKNLDLAEKLFTKLIQMNKLLSVSELPEYEIFSIKNERKDFVGAWNYCLQCAEKGQLWAMMECVKISWNKEYSSIFKNETRLGTRLETTLKWLHQIINLYDYRMKNLSMFKSDHKFRIDRNKLALNYARKYLYSGLNIPGLLKTWSHTYETPFDDFGLTLYYCDQDKIQEHLISVLNDLKEKDSSPDLLAHFVYTYGLNWKIFYQKFPIQFTYFGQDLCDDDKGVNDVKSTSSQENIDQNNYLSVNLQHEKLTEIYRDMKYSSSPSSLGYILPGDIVNLIGDYIPWFSLVKEQDRLSTKKRKLQAF